MDENKLREIFLERLHLEINLFKDSMLQGKKEDIYSASYKIEVYVNLYEILVAEAEEMQEPLLRKLLYQRTGILDAFYEEWMEYPDGFYNEVSEYARDELEVLSAGENNSGKEDRYGKEQGQNKAA